jgi:tripartite-type tricarboxylate transporter receptor subunit TctC
MKFYASLKGLLLTTLLLGSAAQAGPWPERPITLVVPYSAGGSTDATGRLVAEQLSKNLGQPVVVENRAGAGSNIGSSYVAHAAPDGYTLLLAASTIATNVSLYKDMGFDLRKDLLPVSQVARIPNVLVVNKDFPAKSLSEFVSYVHDQKGAVYYGSAGNGSSQHLSGALFNSMAGGAMVQVPYKGGAPANTDLLAGQIQAVFAPRVEVLPYIDSGKLLALGVTTKERSDRLPDVPAITEALPEYEIALWNGIFAPAGTPDAVVDKIASAVHKIAEDKAVRKIFAEQGTVPVGSPPDQFHAFLASEIGKWAKLVKLSGASIN